MKFGFTAKHTSEKSIGKESMFNFVRVTDTKKNEIPKALNGYKNDHVCAKPG